MNRANSIKKAVRRVIEMTTEAFEKSKSEDIKRISVSSGEKPTKISPRVIKKKNKDMPEIPSIELLVFLEI
jgi:hypothetical protein